VEISALSRFVRNQLGGGVVISASLGIPGEVVSICIFMAAKTRNGVFVTCMIALLFVRSGAWLFPEHRQITLLAVQRLAPEQQTLLQRLWLETRVGHEARLCENAADNSQGTNPTCIDYAAWPAIAGDHSCSARDMLDGVLKAPWVPGVVRVGARLNARLTAATTRHQRVNAVRDSDLALQRTDRDYATRASSNNAHFLLAKPSVATEPKAYAQLALGSQAGVNALGTYVWYHLRAVQQAMRIAHDQVPPETRAATVRAALADEAFALHFLEDSFAAGHIAGNWGSTAVRKGTHDYYSEHGVSLHTWDDRSFVDLGDAYMRPEDADRTAVAVRDSLAQLLDAFAGKFEVSVAEQDASASPNGFDVCRETHFPAATGARADIAKVVPVIEQTPIPALGAGFGELPRFRSELGPFLGFSSAFRFGALTRGFGTAQTDVSNIAGLDAAFRVGYGLEGVLDESSDGLVFLEVGAREDRHASGVLTVPGRGAITSRLRAPFWLVPGDLLIVGPILAFASPKSFQKMAVEAANGGLIPWQSGIATRFGRFQVVLGREVGVSFYNTGSDHPVIIPTSGVPPLNATLITLKSLQFDFPLFEYRLFRRFSENQSSGLMIQPYVGFDKPRDSSVVGPPGAQNPRLHTVVTAGFRLVFDWRHYFK
jgi:hypothetical protein